MSLQVSVCHCDCDEEMLETVMKVVEETVNQMECCRVLYNVADTVKIRLDSLYPPSNWNCIVGSYGAFVTPKRGQFVHVAVEQSYSILMFKCQSENEFALNRHTTKQRSSNRSSSLSQSSTSLPYKSSNEQHTVSATSPLHTKSAMSPSVTSPTYTSTIKDNSTVSPSMDSVTSFNLHHHGDGIIAHAVDSMLVKKDRDLKEICAIADEPHHLIADAIDSIVIQNNRNVQGSEVVPEDADAMPQPEYQEPHYLIARAVDSILIKKERDLK